MWYYNRKIITISLSLFLWDERGNANCSCACNGTFCLKKVNWIAYNSFVWYRTSFYSICALHSTPCFVHCHPVLDGWFLHSSVFFSLFWMHLSLLFMSINISACAHLYENHDIQSKWIHQNLTKYLIVLPLVHFWLSVDGKRAYSHFFYLSFSPFFLRLSFCFFSLQFFVFVRFSSLLFQLCIFFWSLHVLFRNVL